MLYFLHDVKLLLWKVIGRWKCFWIKGESGFFSSFLALHCSAASQKLSLSACDLRRLKGILSIGVVGMENPVSTFHLAWKFLKESLRNTATELESPSHLSQGFPGNAGAGMCIRGSCTNCGCWKPLPSWQDWSLEERQRTWHMSDFRLQRECCGISPSVSVCEHQICQHISILKCSFTKGS